VVTVDEPCDDVGRGLLSLPSPAQVNAALEAAGKSLNTHLKILRDVGGIKPRSGRRLSPQPLHSEAECLEGHLATIRILLNAAESDSELRLQIQRALGKVVERA